MPGLDSDSLFDLKGRIEEISLQKTAERQTISRKLLTYELLKRTRPWTELTNLRSKLTRFAKSIRFLSNVLSNYDVQIKWISFIPRYQHVQWKYLIECLNLARIQYQKFRIVIIFFPRFSGCGFREKISWASLKILWFFCSFDLIVFFHDFEEFDVQFPVKTKIPSRYKSQYFFVPIRKRKLW